MFQGAIKAAPQPVASAWRIPARFLLLFLLALSAWSFWLYAGPQPPLAPPPTEVTDGALYQAIAARVAKGESYYAAAATEQRGRGFPLRPVVVVRPPVLAKVTATVGGPVVMGWLLRLTGFATFAAFALRFATDIAHPPTRIAAIFVAALSIYILTPIDLAVYHDIWAGMLVALALALRRPDRWLLSAAVAVLAAWTRELAFPLLIVMTFAALVERRWKEAAGWASALILAASLLVTHWMQVAAIPNTDNLVSQGWFRVMGWPWVVHVYSMTSLLVILPASIGCALVPVALMGWITVERSLALRASLWMVGMACVFMLFGREENYYWGALVAPILPIGLAFAPGGITRLLRIAR